MPAVFLNISDNAHAADQIATETNIKLVIDLYIESLSSSAGPAATYIAMMKHNVSDCERTQIILLSLPSRLSERQTK